MNAHARYRLTPDLYRQQWADWMRHVSKWRRWLIPVALGAIAVGIALLLLDHRRPAIGAGLVLAVGGVYQLIWHFADRRRWLAKMTSSKATGSEVEIRFGDEGLAMQGPFSQGHVVWAGLDRAIMTPRGLFLYLDKGLHVYVPDSGLTPREAKAEIAERINGPAVGSERSPAQPRPG